MEKRKIVVIDSATNRKVEVMTDATTLGELKRDLRPTGIDFEGKDWLEGFSQSSPVNDSSQLPQAVTYQGKTTNNLVYMLTNTNKMIKNGMDRKEAYAYLSNNAVLKDAIKAKYGKNYTQVKTDELEKMITEDINNNACACTKKGTKENPEELPKDEAQCADCTLTSDDIKVILDDIHHKLLMVQSWLEQTLVIKPVEVTLTEEDFNEIFE